MKVSVIVPIYSVEKYVQKCVTSLMEQTLNDIEYIFVDDCSPDNSVAILVETISLFPQRKENVHILHHNKNRGLAAARNTGLEIAKGEYIIFCDSDDWIEKDMYEKLYNNAVKNNSDIVCSDYFMDYKINKSIIIKQNFTSDNIECINKMFCGDLHCGTWNKLIRRNLLFSNNISFKEGINMWEDVITIIPAFYYAKRITYVPEAFYHYIQYNDSSYIRSMKESSLYNLIDAIDFLQTFIEKNSITECINTFCYMKLTAKINLLVYGSNKQKRQWNKLYPEANKNILRHKNMSLYWRLSLFLSKYIGLSFFNMMVFLRNKIK